jgi:acetyl esterase
MSNKHKPKTAKIAHSKPLHIPFYRRSLFVWLAGTVVGLSIVTLRATFNHSSQQALAALEKHAPRVPITTIANQQYRRGDHTALLDVYVPSSAQQTTQALPVLVWTHGGAWVSGDKTNDGPYFKLLAAQGIVVVSLNYTLAPEKSYPTQIFELNDAHAYIIAHANQFHINPNKIFLAGDSAGSQLTAQMDALITNPSYAKELGIQPSLQPSQLAGTALFCGIYQMKGLTEANPNMPKIISWGDDEVVWAFSGTRNNASPIIRQMSPYYHVTKDFPATFISGGNGDPLTNKQSVPLAGRLKTLRVPVTTLFYSADHQPSLPHEYQFNLDTDDGQQALTQLTQFIRKHAD